MLSLQRLERLKNLFQSGNRSVVFDHNINYKEYEKIFLYAGATLIPVASYDVTEDGIYNVIFSAQTVNNTAHWIKPAVVVMVTAKLFVNGIKSGRVWTENILPKRHYANPMLIRYGLPLKVGDKLAVMMRADSTKLFPDKSVFVLVREDRFQFDVMKV